MVTSLRLARFGLGFGPVLVAALALAPLTGCAAEPADDANEGNSAITADEAASGYDTQEKLVENFSASPEVARLGAKTWSAYAVSNKRFLGLALYAVDARGDVKYVILTQARRAADGKLDIAIFEVDRTGKKVGAVDAATYELLRADMKRLEAPLRRASDMPRTPAQQCVVSLSVVALGGILMISGGALVGWALAAFDTLVVTGSSLFAGLLPAIGLPATFGGGTVMTGTGLVVAMDAWRDGIAACAK